MFNDESFIDYLDKPAAKISYSKSTEANTDTSIVMNEISYSERFRISRTKSLVALAEQNAAQNERFRIIECTVQNINSNDSQNVIQHGRFTISKVKTQELFKTQSVAQPKKFTITRCPTQSSNSETDTQKFDIEIRAQPKKPQDFLEEKSRDFLDEFFGPLATRKKSDTSLDSLINSYLI